MIIVSDNDVRGAVQALRRAIEHEWADEAAIPGICFKQLEEVGLDANSTDGEIYERCLELRAILVTADRTMRDARESFGERDQATESPGWFSGDHNR